MDKNVIFGQRKELKKKAHVTLRSHYFLLVFLMLVMTLFGTESGFSIYWTSTQTEEEADGVGSVYSDDDVDVAGTFRDVFEAIASGRLEEGISRSEKQSEAFRNEENVPKALGRTEGVLATVVNGFVSGRLFAKVGQAARSITHSDVSVAVLFILGALLWYVLIFVFVKNIYSAVIRRISSSESVSICPRFRLARLHTTKSPGFVVVTTTCSSSPPSLRTCTSRLTKVVSVIFCAISVQRFEQ